MSPTTSLPAEPSSGTMDQETRDALLSGHLGLVHHVARQMSRRLAVNFDFDELVSAGTIGLINALDSFDAERGLAFSTYAAPRIRGAILDELRRQDHAPRSIRRKSREMSAAREALIRRGSYSPTDQEMAVQLEVDLETFWRWQSEVEGSFFVPIDEPSDDDDRRSSSPSRTLAGATAEMIEDDINHHQEVEALRNAIMHLKEQERIVLSLYYFEELKLHEIGTILELTESRVSQIRTRSIGKLQKIMSRLRHQAA